MTWRIARIDDQHVGDFLLPIGDLGCLQVEDGHHNVGTAGGGVCVARLGVGGDWQKQHVDSMSTGGRGLQVCKGDDNMKCPPDKEKGTLIAYREDHAPGR